MRLIKGNIEKLTGDVLIYSIYCEKFKSLEFSSINKNTSNYQLFNDGTAFGIYLTNSIDKIEDKFPYFQRACAYSMKYLLEESLSEELTKKILQASLGRELIVSSTPFYFDSEPELLKRFEEVNEVVLPDIFSKVSHCMSHNDINLWDYIISFIYQQKNNPIINMQNKSYGEANVKEIGEIVTGYFNNMNKALVRGDKGEFIDTKRKLLDFAAESLLGGYISKICDLLLKADEKQRFKIVADASLIMQTIKSENYEMADNAKKRLIKIENTLNRQKRTDI